MSGLESARPTEVALLTPSDGAPAAATAADKPFSLFGEDGFTFADFLDIINPFQHIPLVSTLYRHLTGDAIDAGSRVLGGTLFGGPIGAIASLFNVFVEETTGKDLGEHAVALFTDDEAPVDGTAVARDAVPPEARFETAAGAPGDPPTPTAELLASTTDAIVATAQVNRFAVAAVAPPMGGEPLAPPLALGPPAALKPPKDQPSAAATRQVAAATTALRQGERQADAFALLRYRAALRDANHDKDEDKERAAAPPAAGATATDGGWFSDAMLSGLGKYEAAVKQARPAPGISVDLRN
jgi:hypothetical protein